MGGIEINGCYLNRKVIRGIQDKTKDEVRSFTVDATRKPECEDKIYED